VTRQKKTKRQKKDKKKTKKRQKKDKKKTKKRQKKDKKKTKKRQKKDKKTKKFLFAVLLILVLHKDDVYKKASRYKEQSSAKKIEVG
jgi:hypothetical protein